MTQTANGVPQQAGPGEHSAADLAKQVTEQASVLVRDEIKFAQLEMTRATPPLPEETVSSVKTDVAEIKGRAHR
jgi:hypothetical protein